MICDGKFSEFRAPNEIKKMSKNSRFVNHLLPKKTNVMADSLERIYSRKHQGN